MGNILMKLKSSKICHMNANSSPLIILIPILLSILVLAPIIKPIHANGTIVVDGSLNDWEDLGIPPIGTDPDDQLAGYADLLKFWAYMNEENLFLAIQVDWEYPIEHGLVIFSIMITPEDSSSWYEVIWGNYSYAILLGHGGAHGRVQNITSATGWDGVIEFSVPLSLIDNSTIVSLEVNSYSSDWIYNIDMMPAPWEEPYKIPEYLPIIPFLILIMLTSLIAHIQRKKI